MSPLGSEPASDGPVTLDLVEQLMPQGIVGDSGAPASIWGTQQLGVLPEETDSCTEMATGRQLEPG